MYLGICRIYTLVNTPLKYSGSKVQLPHFFLRRSLTPTVYARVGDLFRDRFGQRAGWAHSLLFAAELPAFKASLFVFVFCCVFCSYNPYGCRHAKHSPPTQAFACLFVRTTHTVFSHTETGGGILSLFAGYRRNEN